jgi:hypothetical protein
MPDKLFSGDLFQVLEKLEKTRVLALRGATAGERAAGAAAVERLHARLHTFRTQAKRNTKPDNYSFTMAIASLSELRIAHKLLAEKGGRVLSFVRKPTWMLTAVVPYREDALTIQTLTEWYCDELDDQLSALARNFVHLAKQDLVKFESRVLESNKASGAADQDQKKLEWRLPSKHERNVFGSIAKACGKESYRVASDAKSIMKINAQNDCEASQLSDLLNDVMRRFTRAMMTVNHGYLQAIGAH